MKLSQKNQGIEKQNSGSCTVIEHKLNHDMLDFAIVTITGRYPEERRAVNKECAELAYVSAGQGKVYVNGEETVLNTGDVILIDAGEKFYWEGNMQLHVSCRPAWNIEQHQMVD